MAFDHKSRSWAKKKGPNLAVWACKSILREDGGDNQCIKKLIKLQ